MEKIKLINSSGIEEEFKVVFAYEDPDTEKGYLVYTDGKKKYAARYNPNDDNDLNLEDIDSEEELDKLKKMMKKYGGK